MLAAARRLLQLAERRLPSLTRLRAAEPLPIELTRRRIYILPTAFGAGFGALLLVMLTGALNYANNAALLLTCVLGAGSAASMLVTFRTLDGVCLRGLRSGQAVAGEPIELVCEFTSSRAHDAVRVDLAGHTTACTIVGATELRVQLPTTRRGWLPVPRMRVWSTWPLGLFRAWSWLHPEQSILVWPRAEAAGPSPHQPDANAARLVARPGDELAALRDYRPGDALRHIAWKASAHHQGLMTKEFDRPQPRETWRLEWNALRALDREARISRLTRWVGEAEAQGHRYSLHLPATGVDLGSGPAHYARCMSALAVLP